MAAARWFVPAMLAGAAFGLATVATTRGPGLTTDSVFYLTSGINLASGRGLTTLDGSELTLFPPGLPIIAAAGESIGLSAESTLRWTLIAALAVVVGLSYLHFATTLRTRTAVVVSTAFVAFSPALLGVSVMAWSEAPFIVVVLTLLLVLSHVSERRSTQPIDLAALVGLCWLGFALRYAGVTLVVTAAIVVFLIERPRGARRAAVRTGVFSALALLGPLAWMARNHRVDGTLMGPRTRSFDTPTEVGRRVAATVGDWVFPVDEVPPSVRELLGVAAILLLGTLIARRVLRPGVGWDGSASSCFDPTTVRRRLSPHVTFVAVYGVYIVAAQLSTALDPISSRLLSPVYVSLTILVASGVERLVHDERLTGRRRRAILLIGLVLIAAQPLASLRTVRAGAIAGFGFNSRSWVRSELAQAVDAATVRGDNSVYSNRPPGLWASTGLQPIFAAPRVESDGSLSNADVDRFGMTLRCHGEQMLLAVFERADMVVYPVEQLGHEVGLEQIDQLPDGALYRVVERTPTSPKIGDGRCP